MTIDGAIPEEVRGSIGIASGDAAVAADVLKGQERLLTALHEDGYALATVSAPVAYEDPTARVLDVHTRRKQARASPSGKLLFTACMT